MAELQTIAAVFDLLKVTWEAGKFLKRASDADRTALEIHERVTRLENVLEGIKAILKTRDDDGASPGSDEQVVKRIHEAVLSCQKPLAKLWCKAGMAKSSPQEDRSKTPWERVKIAWSSSSINRLNSELEARIHILSTDLTVLQLYEQTKTNDKVDSSHGDVLEALSRVGEQVALGNKLIGEMLQRTVSIGSEASPALTGHDDEALTSLSECVRAAEDVHERFTEQYSSQHQPDNRSERIRQTVGGIDSVSHTAAPSITTATPSTSQRSLFNDWSFPQSGPTSEPVFLDEKDDQPDIWPLEILNRHIDAYAERARLERDSRHYSQAEMNLTQAIRNCNLREGYYQVPFAERLQMQEDLAILYQKQQKFAEAIALIHQLLRDQTPSEEDSKERQRVDIARQNHLLASIYYDRHLTTADALHITLEDIEKAEQHALRAFRLLWEGARQPDRSMDEEFLYTSCVQQLINVLDTRGKHVEATEMRNILDVASDTSSSELRRMSTFHSRISADVVLVDKHVVLLEAIQSGDTEQVHMLLTGKDIDLERLCRNGKTFLTHAVEQSNEAIVNKLLDPEIGAYVDTANSQGLTALHYGASMGYFDMVRCLLEHDADIAIRDRRGETAVVKAVKGGHITTVEVLFDRNGQSLHTRGGDEWNLLHYAVQSSRKAMIDALLDLSPDLADAVDRSGKTALHHCAELERLEMATALLDHKHRSDVNAMDSISRTPLYLAASKPSTTPRRARMVRLLLERGSVIDHKRLPPRIRDYVDLKKPQH